MDTMLLRLVTCVLCLAAICSALPDYQSRLPNGYKVPHPCFANTIWKGVGHQNHEGGGFLNPFGEDFKRNAFQWNQCLCEYDSDGDGMTNGEELGDPDCTWSQGQLPDVLDELHHPGVCEPVDSPECQALNTFEPCEPIDFTCEGMDDDEAFISDARFTEVEIPNTETNYFCYVVQFDDTTDVHAFAMEPIIDNADLVHHIDMYECPAGDQADAALEYYSEPGLCGAMVGCGGNMLAAWALGIEGICLPDNVGIRVGKFGAQVAILRIHYHNPFLRAGETDTSGLKFHMTPVLRQYDSQVLNLGQMYLALPPEQQSLESPITCGPMCTNTFSEDIYLAFGAMHMHYLGLGGYSELWRKGEKVQDIMIQDFYDYNAPHLEIFDPPIKVQVGDTIKHTCRFQSRDRTDWTYRGQSAFDEMCHIYFVHYPAQNLTECFNEGAIETCKYRFSSGRETMDLGECNLDEFRAAYDAYLKDTLSVCDATGAECKEGCKEATDFAIANQTCLHQEDPDTYDYTLKAMGDEFRRKMHSCVELPEAPPMVITTVEPIPCGNGNGADVIEKSVTILVATIFLLWSFI